MTTEKLADKAVTGDKIDLETVPFARVVHRARGSSTKALSVTSLTVYPLRRSPYTQPVGRDDSFIGAVDVVLRGSCACTRGVSAVLLVDPVDPLAPTACEFVARRTLVDTGAEPLRARLRIGPAAGFEPGSATAHTLYLAAEAGCETPGGGVAATFGGVDVIGTE